MKKGFRSAVFSVADSPNGKRSFRLLSQDRDIEILNFTDF